MPFTNKPGTGGGGGGAITSIGLTDGTTPTSTLTAGAGVFGIIPGEGLSASVSGFDITLAATGHGRRDLVTVDNGLSPYAVTIARYFIICDVSGGDVQLNLPAIGAANSGDSWCVIDDGSASTTNKVIVDANTTAGTTINGNNTIEITTARGALNITTDGTTFFVY